MRTRDSTGCHSSLLMQRQVAPVSRDVLAFKYDKKKELHMEDKIKTFSMLIAAIGLLLLGISSLIIAKNYKQEKQTAIELQKTSLKQLNTFLSDRKNDKLLKSP